MRDVSSCVNRSTCWQITNEWWQTNPSSLTLTIAKRLLEALEFPRLDGDHEDEPHGGGEQRGDEEVEDGPERDHPGHLVIIIVLLKKQDISRWNNHNNIWLFDDRQYESHNWLKCQRDI